MRVANTHRLRFVLMLTTTVLGIQPQCRLGYAWIRNGRVGFVDVLTTGARSAESVDAQVCIVDDNVG